MPRKLHDDFEHISTAATASAAAAIAVAAGGGGCAVGAFAATWNVRDVDFVGNISIV